MELSPRKADPRGFTTFGDYTNFVEFRNFKIIYRRYAGLYFCICVDTADNNLFYLEAIHNFVEVSQAETAGLCRQ